MLTEAERAYAAGLFDGEGWVGIVPSRKRGNLYHRLDITINMTDSRPILWLHERFGGYVAWRHHYPQQDQWKPALRLHLQGARAARFLEALLPYLIVKAEQARIALEFWGTTLSRGGTRRVSDELFDRRERMRQGISALNSNKGVGGLIFEMNREASHGA